MRAFFVMREMSSEAADKRLAHGRRRSLERQVREWAERREAGDLAAPHPLTEEEQASLSLYEYAVGAYIDPATCDVVEGPWVSRAEAEVTAEAAYTHDEAAALAHALGDGVEVVMLTLPAPPAPPATEDRETARRRRVASLLPRAERVAHGFGSAEEVEAEAREKAEREAVEAAALRASGSPPDDGPTAKDAREERIARNAAARQARERAEAEEAARRAALTPEEREAEDAERRAARQAARQGTESQTIGAEDVGELPEVLR